ncbi:MAG TPA: hypothetical protein VGR95_05385, partial [Thermoanaerobaculia bacterium]|nr:hypothetical protein [Thermoanaerobaculia bacterium]
MPRPRWFLSLLLLLLASPFALHAASCNLTITVSCTPLHAGQTSTCTSTTMNNGPNACNGTYFSGWSIAAPPQSVAVSNFNSGLPSTLECLSSADEPTNTEESFQFCIGENSIPAGGSLTSTIQVTPTTAAPATIPIAGLTEEVDANDTTGDNYTFVYAFANATLPTCTPTVSTPPISQSGIDYTVSWTQTADPTSYQVDESTSADFTANVTSQTVNGTSATFTHSVATNTTYYYRVHALSCSGGTGPLSTVVNTVVQAPPPPTAKKVDTVVPLGATEPISFQIFVPGVASKTALDTGYSATTDKGYLTVTPATGTLPPSGTTLTVTANPTGLPPGANTGTVTVTPSNGAPINTPVSVSLVTPVALGGKTLPPGNALIIPVVTHVNSGAGPFQSDVRITNAGTSPIDYQVTFTPTRSDGTQTGKITNLTIAGNQTIALNDIAKDFFGYGATGDPNDVGFGSLEIRPINNSSTLTYAASRTFATTSIGTYGQFVAAIPFAQFAGPATASLFSQPTGAPTVISLQQIAESAKFRTNLGLVEGSGTPASGRIRVIDDLGNVLKEIPYSLQPGEHQQLNQFIKNVAGIPNLDDGRIEITVDSPTGAISAYASVLDNVTADPLAVQPVQASQVSAQRYIVPGMAEIVSPFSNFHSDMRIYNGGATSVNVTPTFFPQGGSPITVAPITIGPGQVKAYDNVLPTLFNVTNGGGSVLLTTTDKSSLVATGRTYSYDSHNGTFGQFIPGVSPGTGIGTGDKPLQLLQLEQSSQFRSNIGITELTGNTATVKLTIIPPDGRTSAIVNYTLQPNEFHQFDRIIEQAYGSGVQ